MQLDVADARVGVTYVRGRQCQCNAATPFPLTVGFPRGRLVALSPIYFGRCDSRRQRCCC